MQLTVIIEECQCVRPTIVMQASAILLCLQQAQSIRLVSGQTIWCWTAESNAYLAHIGETTLDHLYRNISIVRNVLKAITPLRPDSVLVVASNPCDLLTSLAQKLSGLPAAQVIGVGTCLDSLRLRGLISDHTEVSYTEIHLVNGILNNRLGGCKLCTH